MSADEPEQGISYAADKEKNPNTISMLNEDEREIPDPNRRPRTLGSSRISAARRSTSMTETHRLQRSITESVSSQALHIFLYNTVIHFPSGSASKGHFTNLVTLVQSSSRSEALPFALDAVALASLAHRFSHPDAMLIAMSRYQVSIRLLRGTDINSESNLLRVIACIQLLGMYEIINANTPESLNWLQHLHGLIAVVSNFLGSSQLPASGIPMLVVGCRTSGRRGDGDPTHGNTSSEILQPAQAQFDNLCSILMRVQGLFTKASPVLEPHSLRYDSTLRQYREETTRLKFELHAWGLAQPEGSRQKTVQHFTQTYTLRSPGVDDLACPSTRAVTYHDYSIACMWITYYQCQLHLTDLLTRINRTLSTDPEAYLQGREYARLHNEAQTFVDDVCAMVPFMLVGETIFGSKPVGSIWLQTRPPMLIGGFNLLWVLFTISILSVVSTNSRQNAKMLLRWIGKNLGIGQATILAQMEKNPPGGVTAKGDALGWAGFLF